MGLDCLGFLRPIRGFSMGYEQSKTKKLRKCPSPGGGRSASPARLFFGAPPGAPRATGRGGQLAAKRLRRQRTFELHTPQLASWNKYRTLTGLWQVKVAISEKRYAGSAGRARRQWLKIFARREPEFGKAVQKDDKGPLAGPASAQCSVMPLASMKLGRWRGPLCPATRSELRPRSIQTPEARRKLSAFAHRGARMSSSTQAGTVSLAGPYRASSKREALSAASRLISQVSAPAARASATNPAAG